MLLQRFLTVDKSGLKGCAVNKFVLKSNKYYINLEIDAFIEGYKSIFKVSTENMRMLFKISFETLFGNQ